MAEIKNKDLTLADELCISADGKYKVHGEGIFDDLMEAMTVHLDSQYMLGRIVGEQYATAYTQSLAQMMQQSVAFLLGRQRADKEAELLVAQKLNTDAQTALVKEQTRTEKVKQDHLRAQIDLTHKQMDKIDAEIDLLNAKICTEKAQACGPGPVDGTVLKGQLDLYTKQSDAFERKSEQQFMQTVVNAWIAHANVEGIGLCGLGPFTLNGMQSFMSEIGGKLGVSIPGNEGCDIEEVEKLFSQLEAKMAKDKLAKLEQQYKAGTLTIDDLRFKVNPFTKIKKPGATAVGSKKTKTMPKP